MSSSSSEFIHMAECFASVCAYHSSINHAVKHLRFLQSMRPTLPVSSQFAIDRDTLDAILAELQRVQTAAGAAGSSPPPPPPQESWSDM